MQPCARSTTSATSATCAYKKGPQAIAWRQHCRDTFLHNTETTVKLHLSIQRATAAGALGSEDYAKAGNSGRAKKNLCRDFKHDIYQGH